MATAQYATGQGGGRDTARLCPLCPSSKAKGFADTASLLQHMKDKHGSDGGQMILVTPIKTNPSQTAMSAVAEEPAAAPPQFQCNTCCRKFNSIGAMEQHQHNKGCSSSSSILSHVNSPLSAPAPQFQCNTCCRKFDSIGAMEQHQLDKGCNSSSRDGNAALQRGPAAAPAPSQCNTCCRKFDSIGAMEQHQRDKGCSSSSFRDGNAAALQRGPAAAPSHQFQCNTCCRKFDSIGAMEQHQFNKRCCLGFREVINAAQQRVEPLQPNGSEYNSLANHFQNMWKTLDRQPRILSIYKIRWSEKLESRFKNYEGQMGPANMGPEAKRTLFHGTKSLCGLLQAADLHQRSSPHQGLCTNPDGCNACSIISRGFKLSKVGPGVFDGGLHSFGPGIYLTSFSHKANDYSRPSDTGHASGIRTVLIVEAVLGKVWKEKIRRIGMTRPPKGYHTVWGVKGEDLNWDEICCYREDGLKPIAAVTYTVTA